MARHPCKRSAVARDLRTPKYRKRIVASKKVYSRKQVKHEQDTR